MKNISQMFLAIFISVLGAGIFIYLHFPLPWLLGSILITSVVIRFEKIPTLKPNTFFTIPARVVIGVTIGSAFTPAILQDLHLYAYSLLFIIPYVALTAFLGVIYYWKFQGFDKKTAYFASMPGGVIEMVILSEEMKADVSKVTLIQASRLLFIVISLPLIIQYFFQIDLRGNQIISEPLSSLSMSELFILVVIGVLGSLLGKKLKLPAAYLMGPMILSVVAFSIGFVESKPPDELLKFVQVILGTTIGFTFKGVKIKEVIKVLISTLGHFVILVSISSIFIAIVYFTLDFSALQILLAFSPGGQAEINLIAILVAANIPYITMHHIVRLIIVFNLAPIFARKYLK